MGIKEKNKVILGFDKLIEPYIEGGTPDDPIDVTIGNICHKLMVQYSIPAAVVGEAIYKVMDHIANKGLVFKGNGEYGSKGAELFSCIKTQCIDISKKKYEKDMLNIILSKVPCFRKCIFRSKKEIIKANSMGYLILLALVGSFVWLCITV